ncbi:MAG: DUF4350 domain-containing protein [Methanospirillum sp.]|nr:DUF4350 domain-containing protein [Methanospirillum sp.]
MPSGERGPGAAWLVWAVGLVVLAGAVALFLHVSSAGDEFSRHNPSWNGTSVFFEELDAREPVVITAPADLRGHPGATLLVVAPGRAPVGDEAGEYRAFVASGGTIVVADDFGAGNALLAAAGTSIRFDQRNLSSLERAFELPAAVLGFPAPGGDLAGNLTAVVFDRPVAVLGGTPLLETSRLSWMDGDGDGRPGANEPLERYILVAHEEIGAGRVVAVGDASLFINAMQDLRVGDNALLLARLAPDGVLVDGVVSRTTGASGPVGTVLWLQERPVLIVAVAAAALIALAVRRPGRRTERGA